MTVLRAPFPNTLDLYYAPVDGASPLPVNPEIATPRLTMLTPGGTNNTSRVIVRIPSDAPVGEYMLRIEGEADRRGRDEGEHRAGTAIVKVLAGAPREGAPGSN